MRLRRLAVLLLFAGSSVMACRMSAQKPLRMTIDELFRRVEQSNVEVKAAQKDVNISRQLEKNARAKRLPDIGLEAGVNYLGDATILERDFSNLTRSAMPHLGNLLSLSLYQPLYSGGEITAGIQKTRYQTQMASTDLKIVTDNIKMEVLDCYLSLLKNRNLLSVYDENIKLTKQLIEEMKVRSEQGLALANDVTRYELTLSNLTYDRSTVANAVEHLNYSLLVYLGLDEGTMIEPWLGTDEMNLPDLGASHWRQEAEMSPKLKRLDLTYSQAKTEEKIVRSRMMPMIGLTAGNSLEGPITNCAPVKNNNINTWWVGVKLSMNLSAFYKDNTSLKSVQHLMLLLLGVGILQAAPKLLQSIYLSSVLKYDSLNTISLNWPILYGVVVGSQLAFATFVKWHWGFKKYFIVALMLLTFYEVSMYFLIDGDTNREAFFIPLFAFGVSEVMIGSASNVYLSQSLPFSHFFFGLNSIGYIRCGIGTALGSATVQRLYNWSISKNSLNAADNMDGTVMPFDLPSWSDTMAVISKQAVMISIKECYGYMTVIGILMMMLIIIHHYRLPVIRLLPRMAAIRQWMNTEKTNDPKGSVIPNKAEEDDENEEDDADCLEDKKEKEN